MCVNRFTRFDGVIMTSVVEEGKSWFNVRRRDLELFSNVFSMLMATNCGSFVGKRLSYGCLQTQSTYSRILDLPKTILNETVLIFFFFYLNETHEK